jgi:hypothetical protein
MLKHKTLVGFLFFMVLTWPLSSATVNFLVVETGPLRESSGEDPSAVFESSALWETCLLDVFFEAGHIVSNSPIRRLAGLSAADFPGKGSPGGEFPREIRPELEDSALGGADYLILVLLFYPQGAADTTTKPEKVNLRVYSFRSGEGSAKAGSSPGKTSACRFIHEDSASLGPSQAAQPGKAGPANRLAGPPGEEIERDRAKRLIRGLVPHIKD